METGCCGQLAVTGLSQGKKGVGSRGNSLTQDLEVSTLGYRYERHLPWLRYFTISSVLPSEFGETYFNIPSYFLLNPFETTKLGHFFPNIQR